MNWKRQAGALFFNGHARAGGIALTVGKARGTVSRHLNKLAGYAAEMKGRAEAAGGRRRAYRREWDRDRAARYNPVDADSIRRGHGQAAIGLSHGRF